MCGIIAVSGNNGTKSNEDLVSMAFEGLRKLEYRGYDSYGFAAQTGGELAVLKSLEPLDERVQGLPASSSIIGHTRWATHGGVSLENCHPHLPEDGSFSLAHNGIVENFQCLCKQYTTLDGEQANNESDSRLILTILAENLLRMSRASALVETVSLLQGRNSIVVLFADGEIYGVRNGSPLVIGKNESTAFIGSDVLSFGDWAQDCFPLQDKELVRLCAGDIQRMSFSGAVLDTCWQTIENQSAYSELNTYPHYMLKEVMEQWQTLPAQKILDEKEFESLLKKIKASRRVFVTGAGGAYFAARQIAWLLNNLAGTDAMAIPAYEVESCENLMAATDLMLAVSQSGETADTIDALELAREKGLYCACLVNMPFSSMTRLCQSTFYNRCGPEICVLSTKSASSQILFGYLLSAGLSNTLTAALERIDELSHILSLYLCSATTQLAENIASDLSAKDNLFVLGRKEFNATAMIAALNIKEASYIHAEAFAAGELKHGVIALVEEGTPVIVYVGKGDAYMLNVCAELKSRGAFIIGIAEEENAFFDRFLPLPGSDIEGLTAVSSIIPGQLLAYFASVSRGHNPDKPRNLAKCVTVR